MGKTYDIQDVLNAGCTLEPLVCRNCGSTEVTFSQYVGDAQCANCGRWQLDIQKREEKVAKKPKKVTPEQLTPEEYAKLNGNRCPYCHSKNIQGDGSMGSDADYAWQDISCRECGKRWIDSYKLVGYLTMD